MLLMFGDIQSVSAGTGTVGNLGVTGEEVIDPGSSEGDMANPLLLDETTEYREIPSLGGNDLGVAGSGLSDHVEDVAAECRRYS